MKYKVKEEYEVLRAGEVGTWAGEDSKRIFLRFKDGDIIGYFREEVEMCRKPFKSESLMRKEDALKTIEMIRIERSKHHSIKQEIDTLLNRLELEVGFIEVGDSNV